MVHSPWEFIIHGLSFFVDQICYCYKNTSCHPERLKDLLFAMPLHPVQFANRSFVPTYDKFVKNFFVILNAVKDLLFAMLLRPVKSANRSFTAFRMTNLLKRHFILQSTPDFQTQDDKTFQNIISSFDLKLYCFFTTGFASIASLINLTGALP